MVAWRQLSLLTTLVFASAATFAENLHLISSETTLRMKHMPLGRFDTVAQNAITDAAFLVEGDEVRLLASPLKFRVESLESMVPLRDAHLKKELESDKYPSIELRDLKASRSKKTFTALMKVRNVETPVSGGFEITEVTTASPYIVKVRLKSAISNFGLHPQQYKGVGVKNDFELLIDLQLEKGLP